MRRRSFLARLTILPALPLVAHAAKAELNIGIYPGTGKADILMGDFRAYAMPFAQALGAALDAKPRLTLFRSIKSALRSLKSGRPDLYFVPPSVAVSVLDNDYSPVARVRDQATGVLVRRKGVAIHTVALTEKEYWLDVMARHALKRNKHESVKIDNFKTQDEMWPWPCSVIMPRPPACAAGWPMNWLQRTRSKSGCPCRPRRISR